MELKLTKSRFKLAMECPAKLYYTGKRKEYPDTNLDNPFLEALAEGGFQVGELAKLYYPDGYNISTVDYDQALKETNELLKNDNVTIFEAAVLYDNLFIRIDILEKKSSKINLIEVKAKSIDIEKHETFFTKNDIKSDWSPYLYDAAFQKYVLTKAFPDYEVSSYLMLANKNSKASVDGLNQRFFITEDERGRTTVKVKDYSDTGNKLLSTIRVDDVADYIYQKRHPLEGADLSFEEYVHKLADAYMGNRKILYPIGSHCGNCEFKASEEDISKGMKSGFRECWKEQTNITDIQFKEQLIFELWNYRKKQDLINNQTYFIKDSPESLFPEKENKNPGLTDNERRILQIQKVKNRDNSPYIDIDGIKSEMASWKYPLHFIDFETTMTAIPFNKGRRPYEGIAFQFSHHVVYEDGTIEHKGQYLNTEQGFFPNYDFIRALKLELESDHGSVFRYATHENTYLAMIHRQLWEDENVISDKEDLLNFIETITHSNDSSVKNWCGSSDMIDLLDIVKRYYYHPAMKGLNSIKVVLPAVMESSFIQDKYSRPVYGSVDGIKSLNFKDHIWVQKDNDGKVKSPYKLLPPLFEGIDQDQLDSFITDETLADGGAAMTAYARMQFSEMTDTEREKISEGLLRYCELDTMAMVMIYEYFRSII